MKTVMLRFLPLLILVSATTGAAEPRFSGSAGLSAGPEAGGVISADGRFNLNAGLLPDTSPQGTGRFTLSAKLQPDPDSIAASCGSVVDLIFKNGFE